MFCHVSGRFSRMAKDTIVDVCCAVEFSLSQVAEVTVFLLEMLDAFLISYSKIFIMINPSLPLLNDREIPRCMPPFCWYRVSGDMKEISGIPGLSFLSPIV